MKEAQSKFLNILTSLPPHILSVAPMMDYTDRHCRYFLRLISKNVLLYTEMITANAILHGDKNYLLNYHPNEHPLALQLGGNDPESLALCTKIAADFGYDEVNLNVGCPSDRVKVGQFGACLMKNPILVAECVLAMRSAANIPITVKTRIGVDDYDSYDNLKKFIILVADAGCNTFIIHARKAWLQGLSPKENREIPPLKYDVVYQLKKDFPDLEIIINGGIKTLEQIQQHLQFVDGVMIGREAYHNPYFLADIDRLFYDGIQKNPTRAEIIENFICYLEQQLALGIPLQKMTRPMLGLFQTLPGARSWRRYVSENVHREGAGIEIVKAALRCVEEKFRVD